MTVQVRRIRADEGPILKATRLRALADAPHAFAQTTADVQLRGDAEWAADAARWATGPTAAAFLADVQGEIVGMVGVFVEAGAGQLVAMWTAPEARGRGIATRLIEAVADWCRDAGLTAVHTGVADGNDAAATLYEGAGFQPSGETRPLGSDPERTERRYRRLLASTPRRAPIPSPNKPGR